MSSSSFAADGEATRLLRRALTVLEHEAPEHARMLGDVVAALDVALSTGAESMSLVVKDGGLAVCPAPRLPAVRAEASVGVVWALLDDTLSVTDALRSRRLHIVGRASHLRRAARALRIFLHGLVRTPSGATLLGELRTLAQHEEERKT